MKHVAPSVVSGATPGKAKARKQVEVLSGGSPLHVPIVKLNGEFQTRELGGGIGSCEADALANIFVVKLCCPVRGKRGTTNVGTEYEDNCCSALLVLVHGGPFLVGGVNGDRAPEDVTLKETSCVEVYEHYQLVVAKREDTQSWKTINRGEAKVGGVVGVPAVGRKFFEDAR